MSGEAGGWRKGVTKAHTEHAQNDRKIEKLRQNATERERGEALKQHKRRKGSVEGEREMKKDQRGFSLEGRFWGGIVSGQGCPSRRKTLQRYVKTTRRRKKDSVPDPSLH